MIRLLSGPDLGVPRIPEAMVVEWTEADYRVVFSYAKQGEGMTAHFASDKHSLREVKTAINDFVEWCLWAYPQCKAVFAAVGIESVERVVKKCGFELFAVAGDYRVYMRGRV